MASITNSDIQGPQVKSYSNICLLNNTRKYRKPNCTCSHNRSSLWLSSWAPQGRRWEACRTQSASDTRSGCRPSAERSGTAWSCCSGMQTNRWLKRYHGLQNTTDYICLCWTNTSWEALCWAETDGEVNSNKGDTGGFTYHIKLVPYLCPFS